MSQQEVLEVLEKHRVPLSLKEICEILGDINFPNETKISATIKRMMDYDEIKVIELDRKLAMKFYKCKRRMRLYYV